MFADCFIDTNVLFYAALGRFSAPEKHRRARDLLANTHFGLSGQVLAEFYVNVTRKSDRPMSSRQAAEWIDRLRDRPCAAVDHELVGEAIRHSERYRINYVDAALIAAAERLGAPLLFTEDLSHDQLYGPVRVINPFRQD
jgi:predicted nucleic acid-binding protein